MNMRMLGRKTLTVELIVHDMAAQDLLVSWLMNESSLYSISIGVHFVSFWMLSLYILRLSIL